MGGVCSAYGEEEACKEVWWGNLGKGTTGGHRRRRDDNIKMDLQVVGYGSMDWIKLAQDWDRWWALENVVINLQVP
jgi:hypothetical protein